MYNRYDMNYFQKQIDALEYYTAEEARLTALVEDERKIALSRPVGVAFVTLGRYTHVVLLFACAPTR